MIGIKTLYKLLLLFVFLTFGVSASYSQTLHAIIFAATDDATIGAGTKRSYDLLVEEVENITNMTGMESQLYFRTGKAFNVDQFYDVLEKLDGKDLSKDVILFYFLGHGFKSPSAYPNLLFSNTNGAISEKDLLESSLRLEDVNNELLSKNARFTMVIGEACNNEFDLGQGNYVQNEVVTMMKGPAKIDSDQYRRLFLFAEGALLITSARQGEPSYISSTEGGAFTQSFLKALHDASTKKNEKAAWVALTDKSRENTRQLAQRKKFEYTQTPHFEVIKPIRYYTPPPTEEKGRTPRNKFFTKVVTLVAPNKVERAFNTALKNGDLMDLEQILVRQGEEGDKLKQKMLLQSPVTFYMAQAMIFEEKEDTTNALLNYSIAYELGKSNRTKRDQVLIDKILKLNERDNVITGLNESKNYQTWLKSKFFEHKGFYENDISVISDNITKIRSEIQDIEESITADRNEISGVQDEISREKDLIKQLEAEIKKLDIKRTQKVDIKLTDMQKESAETIRRIEKLMNDIERGGIVDNQQKFLIDDAVVEFQFAKRNTATNLEPTSKGYQLGKHCTPDIESTTQGIMALLLKPIKEVPDKSVLKVKLKIVGNADWKGSEPGKLLGITYTGEEDIFQEYVNKDGDTKVFTIKRGEQRRITNEELAFLRAYCAYNIIIDILERQGVRDYLVQFQAIEHEKPEALDGETGDPGKPFRGIDIDMTIENLFKHYVDRINELEYEIDDTKDDIRKKERKISKIRSGIEEKEDRIVAKERAIENEENRKAELLKILSDAETKTGIDSKAQKAVENVKSLQFR